MQKYEIFMGKTLALLIFFINKSKLVFCLLENAIDSLKIVGTSSTLSHLFYK